MSYDFVELNNLIRDRNQYPNGSNLLTRELMIGTPCGKEHALQQQASVCKEVTFWIEMFFKKFTNMLFEQFHSRCIQNNWVRATDAYLNLAYGFYNDKFKDDFSQKFNVSAMGINSFTAFIDWAKSESEFVGKSENEFVGTLRIVNSKKTGSHSVICYKQDNQLYISDTSTRGIGVSFEKFINKDNFQYFTTMITRM